MRMTKQCVALGLVVVLASGCSAGSGPGNTANNETQSGSAAESEATKSAAGNPETAEEITGEVTEGIIYPLDTGETISWYIQGNILPHEKYKDASESPFHVGLAENIGITIDWSFPTAGSNASTYTLTLLTDVDNLPDIMTSTNLKGNIVEYMEDGLVWDLTDYIQEYAPDYYAYLKAHPVYDKSTKTDEGRYYGFGFFREDGGWNDTYLGPVVRKDWLKECGLEIPTTISEFENVIRVFHDKYGATFDCEAGKFKASGSPGAFGAYGSANISYYIKDGKLGLAQAEPEWRAYMSWLNKLWEEGLIDQDIMTEDATTIKNKIHNDKCGISIAAMGGITTWNNERAANGEEEVWIGIPYPKSDDGEISWIFGGNGVSNQLSVITTAADEETMKLCLEVLNYGYTEAGNLYWNYGTEGVSWEYDENGVPTFTSLVTDDPDSNAYTKYTGATGNGVCVQNTNLLYQKNTPEAVEANNTWYYVYPDDEAKNVAVSGDCQWPSGASFTSEESSEKGELETNIATYVGEAFSSFLTGTKDVNDDEVWQAYIDGLEELNLSRILEIRQACYDRFIAR